MRLPKWFKTHAPTRYKQHLAECATRPRVTGERAKLRCVPGPAISSLHLPRLESCVKVSIVLDSARSLFPALNAPF